MQMPQVPVSWGEIIDKITILEIKNAKITNVESLANVRKELDVLRAVCGTVATGDPVLIDLKLALSEINATLWDIEDRIRIKEAEKAFDDEFISLARSVYKTNDRRAALKRQINDHLGSELVEEKNYAPY